ncbi:MAG TPA: substrate-binding domain-containing protein [Opitutales bacterium]|nr:substrate-binding domain-containing protein [Opitutales bacterium]
MRSVSQRPPATSSTASRRIALAFPYGRAFVEKVVEGILAYARRQADWQILRFPERLSPSLDWLQGWQGDGAFVIISTPEDARIARALPFPVVNITAYFHRPGVPTVTADHAEIGRLAARHLLERRFRKFGYYGSGDLFFSQLRRDGFVRAIRQQGGNCAVLEVPSVVASGRMWQRQQLELEHWLRSLVPPVAIMASTDLRADMLLETCRRLGLRVPDQIAVIGVDNDPVIVSHAQPPLSSVERDDLRAGEVAASLLHDLMAGRREERQLVFGPPAGVVARQSTETLAVEDPDLAGIVHYIRKHIAENFGVERLPPLVPCSRRTLENRFRAQLGVSPATVIHRLRVDQARRMLEAQNKQPIAAIATACGFSDMRNFRQVFRRLENQTPVEYRRSFLRRGN